MSEPNPVRKRMGRPPKAPEKGKRQNYTFRMSDADRDKVVAAAEHAGRSISEEIEKRIEDSFRQEEITEAVRQSTFRATSESIVHTIQIFFGGKSNMMFGQIVSQALRIAMEKIDPEISDYKDLKKHPEALSAVEKYLQKRISQELNGEIEWDHLKVQYDAFVGGLAKD